MQEHTALMATRKGERKAASQPASDSARRVLQKVAARAGMHTVPAQSDSMLNALVEAHIRFIDTKSANINRSAARDAQADHLSDQWAVLLAAVVGRASGDSIGCLPTPIPIRCGPTVPTRLPSTLARSMRSTTATELVPC